MNDAVDALRELHRKRQDFHSAEKRMTLQIKAICRRFCDGDKDEASVLYAAAVEGKGEHPQALRCTSWLAPMLQARELMEGQRKAVEKQMESRAKALPVAEWVKGVKGFGIGSLAAIVGEAGDLSGYETHSKLWKRMGLAVMSDGRQRRVTGDAALEHGYCASRRSIMWNVGQCVFKSQSQRIDKATGEIKAEAGIYRRIYDDRKAYEADRVETKAHAHNRATRYMEKKLLRDLWRVWRAGEHGVGALP